MIHENFFGSNLQRKTYVLSVLNSVLCLLNLVLNLSIVETTYCGIPHRSDIQHSLSCIWFFTIFILGHCKSSNSTYDETAGNPETCFGFKLFHWTQIAMSFLLSLTLFMFCASVIQSLLMWCIYPNEVNQRLLGIMQSLHKKDDMAMVLLLVLFCVFNSC